MTRLALFLALAPGALFAEGYMRPVPQAQSATAEGLFALATLAFCLSLFFVHRMVNRR